MTALRIAHVLLTKHFAGTERHVLELAAAQAAAGHEVTLVLRRKASRDDPRAIAHRVDPRVHVMLVSDRYGRAVAIALARRAVRRLRPDIAHGHLGMACQALRGLQGSVPTVSTLHLDYVSGQHDHLDGLVAIAPWQIHTLPPALRARATQIDNWTRPLDAAAGARAALRGAIGASDATWVFGAVGRVVASKGMDVLVAAFARARMSDAALAIVGEGRELEGLRACAPAGVSLVGFAARPQDWMSAFDAYVSPAREEPFGLVMLEAMEAGLPVLATATTGARHLAPLIARPLLGIDDVDALAAALAAMHAARPPRRGYALDAYRVEAKAAELDAYYATVRGRIATSRAD